MGKSISAFAYGPDPKLIEIIENFAHVASIASGPMLKMEKRGESGCKVSSKQHKDQLICILPCPSQGAQTQTHGENRIQNALFLTS